MITFFFYCELEQLNVRHLTTDAKTIFMSVIEQLTVK